MPKLVLKGAKLKCSEGLAPSVLDVLDSGFDVDGTPIATVDDHKPDVNIAPFGQCKTLANPAVAAATAAANGVLTPQPCKPVTNAPWSPGASMVTVGDKKALSDDSTCQCQWTGTIDITDPNSDVDIE